MCIYCQILLKARHVVSRDREHMFVSHNAAFLRLTTGLDYNKGKLTFLVIFFSFLRSQIMHKCWLQRTPSNRLICIFFFLIDYSWLKSVFIFPAFVFLFSSCTNLTDRELFCNERWHSQNGIFSSWYYLLLHRLKIRTHFGFTVKSPTEMFKAVALKKDQDFGSYCGQLWCANR